MHDSPGRHRRQPFIPGPATASPVSPAPAAQWEEPLTPLDSLATQWDPTEELAYLLGEATAHESSYAPAPDRGDATTLVGADDMVIVEAEELHDPGADVTADIMATDVTAAELNRLQPAPVTPVVHRHRARRRPRKRTGGGLLRLTSLLIAATAAVTVCVVCVFGGMVSYLPLRQLAVHRTPTYTISAWPLLIYGPWVVASLSVLRAGLHRRRATHSWAVVLLFSLVAMVLCVAQAAHRPLDAAAAALPALAALACFQQLMRQITLSRPPRQAHPRHRVHRPAATSRTTSSDPKP